MALELKLTVEAETRQAEASLARVDRAVASVSDTAKEADARLERMSKELDASLKQAEQSTRKLGTSQDLLTASIVRFASGAAIGLAIQQTIAYGGKITDLAAKTGMSVQAVQKLGEAAENVGVSLDQISTSVAQLGNRLASGDKSAVAALRALGLSFTEIRNASPDEAFLKIARAVGDIPDPMKRSQLAVDLFGRSGLTLLPALNREFDDAARKAGAMADETVKALGDTGDALANLKRDGLALMGEVLGPMAPLVKGLADTFRFLRTEVPGGFNNFWGPIALRQNVGDWWANRPWQVGDASIPTAPTSGPGLAINAPAGPIEMSDAMMSFAVAQLSEQARATTDSVRAMGRGADAAARAAAALAEASANTAAALLNRPGFFQTFLNSGVSSGSGGGYLYTGTTLTNPWGGVGFTGNLGATGSNYSNLMGGGGGFNWLSLLNLVGGGAGMFGSRGGTIGQVATGALSGAALGAGISGMLSSLVGASVFGPLAPIAAVIGGAIPLIKKLFGPSPGAIAGKEADARIAQTQQGLLAQFGSLDAIRATGSAGAALADAWGSRNVQGEAWFNERVKAFEEQNKLLADQQQIQSQIQSIEENILGLEQQRKQIAESLVPTWDQVSQLIDKYKIAEGSLGTQINQLATTSNFTTVINDMETLFRAGADVGGVLYGMREEISKLVRDSVKFGTEIPANMQPFIQELARSGNLLDENGQAITEIGNLRWGAPVKTEADKAREAMEKIDEAISALENSLNGLIAKLDEIIDRLANGIPSAAAQGAREAGGHISTIEGPEHRGGSVDESGATGYSRGGPVYASRGLFIPRGTDTVPAMLTPGEFVMSSAATRRIGVGTLARMNRGESVSSGVSVNIHVAGYLDSQAARAHLASVVAAEIGRELRVRRRA